MSRWRAMTSEAVLWWQQGMRGWNQFWFAPRLPHTLALIRIATGAMFFYTLLVLATDLRSFIGAEAWIDNATVSDLHGGRIVARNGDWGWSYLWSIDSPAVFWGHHLFAMAVAAAVAMGLATRIVTPLAWGLQLMYVHRLTGTLFGLDQVVTLLLMYLMLAPCGAVYSLDAVLRRRWASQRPLVGWWAWLWPPATPSTAATIATRLGQLHLCVIYLFGGLWKVRGETWWDGSAVWFAAANFEYQSADLTWWVARYPRLCSSLAHVTVLWETFYIALVWPKWTRPIVLALAVAVHGGIALFLGMITFGTIMIVANLLFVSPALVRQVFARKAT